MKNKLCALALCLLLLAAFPLSALADGNTPPAPGLSVSCEFLDNSSAAVTVSIINNPGIAGFDIDLSINSPEKLLAVTAVIPGENLGGDGVYLIDNRDSAPGAGVLSVVSVRANEVQGDTVLFSAVLTMADTEFDSITFTASGTGCTEQPEKYSLGSAEASLYGNLFSVDLNGSGLRQNGTALSGSAALFVDSFDSGLAAEISYSGAAKAILCCYEAGRYCGCMIMDITIHANSHNQYQWDDVSFSLKTGDNPSLRFLLTDGNFTPLYAENIDIPR